MAARNPEPVVPPPLERIGIITIGRKNWVEGVNHKGSAEADAAIAKELGRPGGLWEGGEPWDAPRDVLAETPGLLPHKMQWRGGPVQVQLAMHISETMTPPLVCVMAGPPGEAGSATLIEWITVRGCGVLLHAVTPAGTRVDPRGKGWNRVRARVVETADSLVLVFMRATLAESGGVEHEIVGALTLAPCEDAMEYLRMDQAYRAICNASNFHRHRRVQTAEEQEAEKRELEREAAYQKSVHERQAARERRAAEREAAERSAARVPPEAARALIENAAEPHNREHLEKVAAAELPERESDANWGDW